MSKNTEYWGYGHKKDVALSYEDYLDIHQILLDDRLSAHGLMKWKNLAQINMFGMMYVPIYCFPIAWGLTNLILGKARRS